MSATAQKIVTDPVPPAVAATTPPSVASPGDDSGTTATLDDAAVKAGNTSVILGVAPVEGIAPVDGWTLLSGDEHDGDRFWTPFYVARHPDRGDVLLPTSRFHFTPSQDRFAWLVRNGFPHSGRGNWDDTSIEHRMEQDRRLAA